MQPGITENIKNRYLQLVDFHATMDYNIHMIQTYGG